MAPVVPLSQVQTSATSDASEPYVMIDGVRYVMRHCHVFNKHSERHQWNLTHGDFNLDRRVDLDSGDASHHIHRTTHEHPHQTRTQPDQSHACGFSSPNAPRCWYLLRKETCG